VKTQGRRCKVVAGFYFSFKTRTGTKNMWSTGVLCKSSGIFKEIKNYFRVENTVY
jgi:hypothetical protein